MKRGGYENFPYSSHLIPPSLIFILFFGIQMGIVINKRDRLGSG